MQVTHTHIGGQLERPEHPFCVQEAPSDMSSASDGHTIGETAEPFIRRLIDRANEVRSIIRDRDAGAGVPNHLQELLLLSVRMLSNLCEGLLDPIQDGRQVRVRHIFQKSWAVVDKKAGIRAGKLRRQGLAVAGLGTAMRLRTVGIGKASTDLVQGRLNVPEAIGRRMEAAKRIVHPTITALGIVQRRPSGTEASRWGRWWLCRGHLSLSRRTFAKKGQEGPKETGEIGQDLEVEAALSVPAVEREAARFAKTEREAHVITVTGPSTRTVPLAGTPHLGLQFLQSDSPSAAEQGRRVGERGRPPSGNLEDNPKQDKPEHSGKGDGPV
jgi:hypothetical protein